MAEVIIPLMENISLGIGDEIPARNGYSTTQLQKGIILRQDGVSLAEEGVGFGLPVAKRGRATIFSGHMDLAWQAGNGLWTITALYVMDLEERISLPKLGNVEDSTVYALKNFLADLHRRHPALRSMLTAASNGLRRGLGFETVYQQVESYGIVKMTFTVHCERGQVSVEIDTFGLTKERLTEIVVMNEQGALHFDRYQDTGGNCLQGKAIGTWDEVNAKEASFICEECHLAFSLGQIRGARLFRGRELIGSRLAWSGFGYLLDLNEVVQHYDLWVRRYP